jgi:hypothetical protein
VPTSSSTHTNFNAASSTSLIQTQTEWDIRYGTGNTEGYLAEDVVSVGGLAVQNQSFALANETSSIFATSGSDGIMGMGFQSIASSGAPTWFENLAKSGSVSHAAILPLARVVVLICCILPRPPARLQCFRLLLAAGVRSDAGV